MELQTISETRKVALEKWREYKDAFKKTRNPLYKDLKSVYNQIKSGQKLVDIFKVIQKGGVHKNYHPKFAIAKATTKKVWCRYHSTGTVDFFNQDISWNSKLMAHDISLDRCLPVWDRNQLFNGQEWKPSDFKLSAPVPIIPPQHLPDKLTDDYYVLWEVDEWKMIPPTDPWLLRRVTKTMFVVLAGWDLTELEKSVMHGRMY